MKTNFVGKKCHDICFVNFYCKFNGLVVLNHVFKIVKASLMQFWKWSVFGYGIVILVSSANSIDFFRFVFLTVVLLKRQLILWAETLSLGAWFAMFWRFVVPLSSGLGSGQRVAWIGYDVWEQLIHIMRRTRGPFIEPWGTWYFILPQLDYML